MSREGKRFNAGKVIVSAIPPLWTWAQAEVFTGGMEKYDRNNWLKGLSYSETLDSLERHLLKWKKGVTIDEESGYHTLAHVGVNASFLHHFDMHPGLYSQFNDLPYIESDLSNFVETLRSE